ncbi:MarR family winged helix-turn-helix transcriptional regulator [Rudaeicoccus suwonensis]|uniref:DNA-binding MarR family transcriptional regulator n=1 Tax=Rudaeicoccus suwonensis TaxID=657409 RepID=A0A561E3D0_9MICO|nr:MarR family transcriptional regulator [Rudaeicoccus suwonensis]TWE10101.1 DNA-binding MarR family transcriptional regulator [Rudaeicoccus suwonensis]
MSQTQAVRAVVRLARILERSSTQLSLPHYRVLSAIAEGHERASRLAIRLALGKPAISASVDTLIRQGLVSRHTSASDQRAARLQLTAQGVAALEQAEQAMAARLDEVLARCDVADDFVEQLAAVEVGVESLAAERLTAR